MNRYAGEDLALILDQFEKEAVIEKLDRWEITISPREGDPEVRVFNNYFSIGVDAKISLQFHLLREEKPYLFQSRLFNKSVYGVYGLQNMVSKDEKHELKDF